MESVRGGLGRRLGSTGVIRSPAGRLQKEGETHQDHQAWGSRDRSVPLGRQASQSCLAGPPTPVSSLRASVTPKPLPTSQLPAPPRSSPSLSAERPLRGRRWSRPSLARNSTRAEPPTPAEGRGHENQDPDPCSCPHSTHTVTHIHIRPMQIHTCTRGSWGLQPPGRYGTQKQQPLGPQLPHTACACITPAARWAHGSLQPITLQLPLPAPGVGTSTPAKNHPIARLPPALFLLPTLQPSPTVLPPQGPQTLTGHWEVGGACGAHELLSSVPSGFRDTHLQCKAQNTSFLNPSSAEVSQPASLGGQPSPNHWEESSGNPPVKKGKADGSVKSTVQPDSVCMLSDDGDPNPSARSCSPSPAPDQDPRAATPCDAGSTGVHFSHPGLASSAHLPPRRSRPLPAKPRAGTRETGSFL